MTNAEAKAIMENLIYLYRPLGDSLKAWEKAIDALEKQIPKKPTKKPTRKTIYTEYLRRYDTISVCPVCGVDTPIPRELESWEFWCPDCGQAIDWSEEDQV